MLISTHPLRRIRLCQSFTLFAGKSHWEHQRVKKKSCCWARSDEWLTCSEERPAGSEVGILRRRQSGCRSESLGLGKVKGSTVHRQSRGLYLKWNTMPSITVVRYLDVNPQEWTTGKENMISSASPELSGNLSMNQTLEGHQGGKFLPHPCLYDSFWIFLGYWIEHLMAELRWKHFLPLSLSLSLSFHLVWRKAETLQTLVHVLLTWSVLSGTIMVITWNENFRKLTTSDQFGTWSFNPLTLRTVCDVKWLIDTMDMCASGTA